MQTHASVFLSGFRRCDMLWHVEHASRNVGTAAITASRLDQSAVRREPECL